MAISASKIQFIKALASRLPNHNAYVQSIDGCNVDIIWDMPMNVLLDANDGIGILAHNQHKYFAKDTWEQAITQIVQDVSKYNCCL